LIVLALAGLSTTTTFMEYPFRNRLYEVAQHGEGGRRCQRAENRGAALSLRERKIRGCRAILRA
jgi:hypothetical protein